MRKILQLKIIINNLCIVFMTNFFKKSDLSRSDAENIVSDTLRNCDDGELYLEDSKSESIILDDNKIKNSSYSSDLGFGLRAITDEIVAYSHSNEISKNSLKQSSESLKSTLTSKKGIYNHSIPKSNKRYYESINPIEQKSLNEKIEILNADTTFANSNLHPDYWRLIGNISFKHNNSIMNCDSAYHFMLENKIIAFGRIKIEQEANIMISGEKLIYTAKNTQANIYKNVIL